MTFTKIAALALGTGTLAVIAIITLVVPAGKPKVAAAGPNVRVAPPPRAQVARPAGPVGSQHGPRGSRAPSAYMTALMKFESEQNWVEFGTRAFNEAGRVDPADRATTIDLVMPHQANGGFPALFCLARLYWYSGDKEKACTWFIRANVVYSIDANRCTDKTAGQAVQVVKAQFKPLLEHLNTVDTATKRAWTMEALEYEETIAEREPPQWIVAHGMAAIRKAASAKTPSKTTPSKPAQGRAAPSPDAPPDFVSDEEWPEVREKARASLVRSIAK